MPRSPHMKRLLLIYKRLLLVTHFTARERETRTRHGLRKPADRLGISFPDRGANFRMMVPPDPCELAHMDSVAAGGAVGTLCRWGGNLPEGEYEMSALGALLCL